ncbi:DnaA/Hda family protein [Phycisphaera mikurensis]|uniref:Chromosomal replication initiator protein DnaA n=1 Tax=Phycisphaera mikurensis (strain NBRC 102666 / KCTC 22515 / FYK2301M01) TaxID=1142394 RepID=I0IBT8_PHYMF|nr:DnaA/Hda family protein [Phycisphaera mikurensis]MBB6442045.1 chromosomal replication initiator protein [Phycisphaera mikurensis]BAM02726.1 putative chromosomal replication initiator protein DnaA [Phycisphaera mikurensis NBRC 102666]
MSALPSLPPLPDEPAAGLPGKTAPAGPRLADAGGRAAGTGNGPPALTPDLRERLLGPLEARFGVGRVSLWIDGGRGLGLDPETGALTLAVPHRFAADRLRQGGLAHALSEAAAGAGLPSCAADAETQPAAGPGCDPAAAGAPGAGRGPHPHLRLVVGPSPTDAAAEAGGGAAEGVSAGRPAAPAAPAGTPGRRPARGGGARTGRAGGGATRRRGGSATPGQRFGNFVTGPCNELGFAAASALASGDHDGPLFVHGPCGTGKTHLVTGLVAAWRERCPGSRVVHTTGERFTNRFIEHARRGTLAAFRREFRGCHLLAVDDVHFIAGKQKTQHELLHCFDAALSAGVPVVFASDRHPRQLQEMGTPLSSRCLQGLVAELEAPAPAMRRTLIAELGARRGLRIDADAAAALEPLAGPGVREIEGLLAKLDVLDRLGPGGRLKAMAPPPGRTAAAGAAPAGAPGRPVGAALVERLRRLERPGPPPRRLNPGPAGVATIAEIVGEALGVEPREALGAGRSRVVVQARALVAHLARELTAMSYPEIARAMGRPSHSGVITADKRVRSQAEADAAVPVAGGGEPVPVRRLLADLRARLRAAG